MFDVNSNNNNKNDSKGTYFLFFWYSSCIYAQAYGRFEGPDLEVYSFVISLYNTLGITLGFQKKEKT